MDDLPTILTVDETAKYLRKCRMTIIRRIASGQLKAYKDGGEWRIKREWLLEYEASLIAATREARTG